MKELVEVIAKALVENPDEVVVTESVKDGETVTFLSVAPLIWVGNRKQSYRESDSLGCQGGFIQGRQESYCRDSVIQTKLKSRLLKVWFFFISNRPVKRSKRMRTRAKKHVASDCASARECAKARSISYRRIIEWLII